MKKILLITLTMMSLSAISQNVLSPELLKLDASVGLLKIVKYCLQGKYPSIEDNNSSLKLYTHPSN
jgi:hypothetical protein